MSWKSIWNVIKKIGRKIWGLLGKIKDSFKKPGKINLKPFEIIIDVIINFFAPGVMTGLKFVSYKAINKKLVEIALKRVSKSLINFLLKIGISVALNSIFAFLVDNIFFKNMHRLLTVGGIICLILDVIDGSVDYWFTYSKKYR